MPKIRIYKYSDFLSPKNYVRLTRKRRYILCKVNLSPLQLSHNQQLRNRS